MNHRHRNRHGISTELPAYRLQTMKDKTKVTARILGAGQKALLLALTFAAALVAGALHCGAHP